jgi:glycosyltransferase involved in cell wall biosynthesis
MSPKISCIIIFLNGEKYIAEAIESVLSQTYEDWELILVDDGTTDGATEIARRYATENSGRIFYTEHPGHRNRGMSASRNAGVAMARGEYVAFLDADDIWLPDRLLRHVEVLEAHPDVSMAMSPTALWSSWNRPKRPTLRPWHWLDLRYDPGVPYGTVLEPPSLVIHYLNKHGAGIPGICSLLIRRAALLEIGGFENEFRRLYEDQVMHFKIFLEHRVIAIDEVLAFYRQHSESVCQVDGVDVADAKARPVFLKWLEDYLKAKSVTDPRIWESLRHETMRSEKRSPVRARSSWKAIVDLWNRETRMAVVWLLTPKVYNRLRERFGMQRQDLFSVPDQTARS